MSDRSRRPSLRCRGGRSVLPRLPLSSFAPPRMSRQQVGLHELASSLPAGTEEDRNAEIQDDGQRAAEYGVRMGVAAIAMEQDIRHAGLDYDARGAVTRQLPQLVPETLPAVNHRGYEIIEGLPLHRNHAFQPCNGVI